MAAAGNVHATLVLLEDRGILIRGASGSGKSTLALTLVSQNTGRGCFARLVADDQLYLSMVNGRVLGRAAAPLRGLVEVRGMGPRKVESETAALVDLVVDLVAPDQAPRYQEGAAETLHGCTVPRLFLPARNSLAAAAAVVAWLRLPPFL